MRYLATAAGADVNIADKEGTPLYVAAHYSHKAIVRCLATEASGAPTST